MILVYLGDTMLTMTTHQSLDPKDEMQFHNVLHFRDIPTGETAEISYSGENSACLAVAAWIAADEKNIGDLEKFRKELYEKLPKGVFLP